MKVVFVVIGVENLAVEFLSGMVKAYGYEADIVFDPRLFASEALQFSNLAEKLDTLKEIAKQVIEKKPDIIGFPVFTLNYQRSLAIAANIKKLNKKIPIIFGGIHPTSVPEVVIKEECVDMVCVGEGEHALVEIMENLMKKEPRTDVKNVWYKKRGKIIRNPCRPLIRNLDKLPFPDKEQFYTLYPGFEDDYYTVSSRGCPFACTYCANNVLQKIYRGLGPIIRRRSPENIVAELVEAKRKFKIKQVTFADDVFVQDPVWLKKFAGLYKKQVCLPYTMLTHPRFITLPVAKLLAHSGCFLLAFGIQSASEQTRREVLKRFETNTQIEMAARNCHLAGIKFSIDHIFNIPGEGLEEQATALKFYNKLRPAVINSYWLQYFPKTEIIKTAIKKGVIRENMVPDIERGLTSTSFVVGFGGKDTFNTNQVFSKFQFLFMLLPLLPGKVADWVIKNKWYLFNVRPPIFVNIGIKFIINLTQRRGYVYLNILRSLLYFSIYNLRIKWLYRN